MVLFFMKTRFFRARCGAVAAFGALIFSFSVGAQDGAGEVALQEVFVTASRFARPVKEVLADVTVIDRQQIEESGATTVLQLLETLPGLQVKSSDGRTSNVYIRGGEARMTGLLIDGARMGGQDGIARIGGGVPWDIIPLGDVERIEIVRGPSSVAYGSDAMAGVIQIITRKGEAGIHPFVSVGVGSYNTQQIMGGVRGAQDAWDYAVHAGSNRSDGFNTRPDISHSPSTESSKNVEAGLALGYKVDATNRLEVKTSQNRMQSRFVDSYGLTYPTDATANTSMSALTAAWESQWTDALSTSAKLTRSNSGYQDDDYNSNYTTSLKGLSFDGKWKAFGGVVSGFLESKSDNLFSVADSNNTYVDANRINDAQGFGYSAKWGLHEGQINLRRDNDSLFGVSQIGAASYAYQVATAWRASTSVGNSFRAPTLEQMYGVYGNTFLSPEQGHNVDLTLAYASSGEEAKVSVYRNVYDNFITTDANYNYANVARAFVQGATLSGSKRFSLFRLHGSVDRINPRYDAGDYAGNFLSLRSTQSMNAGIETVVGEWTLGADVRDVGQNFDSANNKNVNRGYTLLNVRAQTEVAKDWTWTMRINNVTDQDYKQSYLANTVSPRINFFTTLQWAPK